MFGDRSLLEPTMPILTETLNEEYERLIEIFKKVITAEEENTEFFESPTTFLKKANALTLDHVKTPSGQLIPTIDDDILSETIRRARTMYFDGKISVDEVKSSIAHSEKSTTFYKETSESTSSHREKTVWIYSGETKSSSSWHSTEKSTGVHKEGRNLLTIDGLYIGPLVDPTVFYDPSIPPEIFELEEAIPGIIGGYPGVVDPPEYLENLKTHLEDTLARIEEQIENMD